MAGSAEYSPMPTSTTGSLFDEYEVSSMAGSAEYSPMPTSTTDPCLMSMR